MRLSAFPPVRCCGSISGVVLLLALLFSSCTIDAPEVLNTAVSYEYIAEPLNPDEPANPDGNSCSFREQMSFTLTVHEPQGEKDIQKAEVYGPESLVWTIPYSEMRTEASGTNLQLMLPVLVPPPGEELLPQGAYTILLHDMSGETGKAEYSHVSIFRAGISVRAVLHAEQDTENPFSERFPRLVLYEAEELNEIPSEQKLQHTYIETPGFPLCIRTVSSSGKVFSAYAVDNEVYSVTQRGNGRFMLHIPKQLWRQLADDHSNADGVYLSVKDPVTGNVYTSGMFSFTSLLGAENQ